MKSRLFYLLILLTGLVITFNACNNQKDKSGKINASHKINKDSLEYSVSSMTNYDKAKSLFDTILKYYPNDWLIINQQAQFKIQTNNFNGAIKDLNKVIKNSKEKADYTNALRIKAVAYSSISKSDSAIYFLNKYRSLTEDTAGYYFTLTNIYSNLKKVDSALKYINLHIKFVKKRNPNLNLGVEYYNKTCYLLYLKDTLQACKSYHQALKNGFKSKLSVKDFDSYCKGGR